MLAISPLMQAMQPETEPLIWVGAIGAVCVQFSVAAGRRAPPSQRF